MAESAAVLLCGTKSCFSSFLANPACPTPVGTASEWTPYIWRLPAIVGISEASSSLLLFLSARRQQKEIMSETNRPG